MPIILTAAQERLAALEVIKDLLDEWDEEATRRENRAYRNGGAASESAWLESKLDEARAEATRECIEELGAMFPAAKLWHAEGVVPADDDQPQVEGEGRAR